MALIEITSFHLAAGVDAETYLAADEQLRTGFLYQQPGLLRSTTARNDDGEWAVINLWASADQADAAAGAAAPERDAALALVDGATIHRRTYAPFD